MQLLIEIVPDMKRVEVLFNPNIRAPSPKCAERRMRYARSATSPVGDFTDACQAS